MSSKNSTNDFKIIKISQASDLAKTISNKTAQTIIEHIGSQEKITSSKIAKDLSLPASTVHYNLKSLVKAGIVDDTEFTYSKKGKTIIHYTLTNNILVILPQGQDEFSLLNSIKALVPSLVGVGVLGVAYQLFFKKQQLSPSSFAAPMAASSRANTFEVAQESISDEMAKSLPDAMIQTTSSSHLIPDFVWGVILTTIIMVVLFLLFTYLHKKRTNKRNKKNH